MTNDTIAALGSMVIAVAYVGLIALLRAIVTFRAVLPMLLVTVVGSFGFLVFLPRSGIDRFIGFWFVGGLAIAMAWSVRGRRAGRVKKNADSDSRDEHATDRDQEPMDVLRARYRRELQERRSSSEPTQ